MAPQRLGAGCWGGLVAALPALLIVPRSRNLQHFDAALVGHTFATLATAPARYLYHFDRCRQ